MQASFEAEARGKADFVRTKKKLEQDINELEIALDTANRGRAESEKNVKKLQQQIVEIHQVRTCCYLGYQYALLGSTSLPVSLVQCRFVEAFIRLVEQAIYL